MEAQKIENKPVWPTISFYAVGVLAIFILNKISPSGPCTPGLGMFAFVVLLPVSIVLFLRAAFLALSNNKDFWPIAFLHLVALAALVIFMSINGK